MVTQASKGKKILVIDDDRAVVRLLQCRLAAHGYNVLAAFDGVSGLEKVEQASPDLITLDVMMPELNGYSVCSFLKTHEKYKSIPIIMITVRSDKNDSVFDTTFSPEAYVTKPFNMDELLTRIEELLKR